MSPTVATPGVNVSGNEKTIFAIVLAIAVVIIVSVYNIYHGEVSNNALVLGAMVLVAALVYALYPLLYLRCQQRPIPE